MSWVLALVALAIFGLHPQNVVAQPFIMMFTGPEEVVLPWGQYEIINSPDGPISFRRDGSVVKTWFSGGGGTNYLIGPDFDHLGPGIADASGNAMKVFRPSGSGFDSGYAAAYSVIAAANGSDLLMIYHAEQYFANQTGDIFLRCTRYSIGLARSSDGGVTWTRLGEIISGQQAFVQPCATSTQGWLRGEGARPFQGAGNPTVTLSPDGQYLYLYYTDALNTLIQGETDGLRMARAPVSSDGVPGSWQKYYQGSFSQPGLGGLGSPVVQRVGGPAISVNTYLNNYLMVAMKADGIYYTSSADGIAWVQPRRLWAVPSDGANELLNVGDSFYPYPTFLSTDQPSQMTTGQTGYLYYAHVTVRADIRYFRNMARRPVVLAPVDPRPEYRFDQGPGEWSCVHCSFDSPPTNGFLTVRLESPDPYLVGPGALWQASDVPKLYIRAAISSRLNTAEVFFTRLDDMLFSQSKKVQFPIVPDGQMRTYEVNLASSPAYTGLITGLRFDPVFSGAPGEYMQLAWISWRDLWRNAGPLTLSLNQATFHRGDTLRVGLGARNPGPAFNADFYFGVLLPDGMTLLFLTSLSPLAGMVSRLDANPQTFKPLLTNILLPANLDVSFDTVFEVTFSGTEPVGTYVFFAALTPPGAFSDGRTDAHDILAIDAKSLGFGP